MMRAICLALVLFGCAPENQSRRDQSWTVLTSLPLFWGGGTFADELAGRTAPSSVIAQLSEGRKLVPIDTAETRVLASVRNLLLIQPHLLPPEELVALDAWVRAGGRMVILADPDLHWATALAPGDRRIPPPSTLLDPLFAHWGLRLDGMRGALQEEAGQINGRLVRFRNRGHLVSRKKECIVADMNARASCRIGAGYVEIIADVDFVDPAYAASSETDGIAALNQLLLTVERP